jgi:hypothetical protein
MADVKPVVLLNLRECETEIEKNQGMTPASVLGGHLLKTKGKKSRATVYCTPV